MQPLSLEPAQGHHQPADTGKETQQCQDRIDALLRAEILHDTADHSPEGGQTDDNGSQRRPAGNRAVILPLGQEKRQRRQEQHRADGIPGENAQAGAGPYHTALIVSGAQLCLPQKKGPQRQQRRQSQQQSAFLFLFHGRPSLYLAAFQYNTPGPGWKAHFL